MAQIYDTAVKLLFRQSRGILIRQLLGAPVVEWLNIELPRVENPRVDLLARNELGELVHLELQAQNDVSMPRREAEYYMGLYRLFDQPVKQVVLYIGKQPLRMESTWKTEALTFKFTLIDIRDLDGEPLLESDDLGDNILALLTRTQKEKVIERVLQKIAKLDGREQEAAALLFVIVSGLRDLEERVLERTRTHMPQLIDIMENKVLGPAYRKGIEEGIEQGIEKGIRKGEATLLQLQLGARFGDLPLSIRHRLDQATEDELNLWGRRVLTASTLEEVFA